ncbi:tetratricopeptide repeat protein [Flavobacteriaceae bacterium]|nr:tetratricopeptide repeat protein [Flavobacteriaceae bacterium]
MGNMLKAQTQLDSLYAIWKDKAEVDSVRTKAYYDYIWKGFLNSKPDSALILARNLVKFGEENKYTKAKYNGYRIQGTVYKNKSDYSKAMEYQEKSLVLQKQEGDKRGIAGTLHAIAIINRKKGNYVKAVDYYNKSIAINKQLNNQKGIANSEVAKGVVYSMQGNYPKALGFFKSSLKRYEQLDDQNGISGSLTNIGSIYEEQKKHDSALDYYQKALAIQKLLNNQYYVSTLLHNMGNVSLGKGDYSKALDFFAQSKTINEKLGSKIDIALDLDGIGSVYHEMGQNMKALDYYKQSLKIKEDLGNEINVAKSLIDIGQTYLDKGNYSRSIDNCQKGYELLKSKPNLQVIQKNACECLYKSFKGENKLDKAIFYLEKYRVLNDDVISKETVTKLQQMEFKKEMIADSLAYSKKEAIGKMKLEKSENTKRGLIIGTILLILLSCFIYYGYRQKRNANRYLKERNAFEIENKKKAMSLFSQQVSPEVAKELLSDSYKTGAKKVRACIMFLDIRNFTPFSESRDAAEINKYQNDVFGFMIDIISQHNGIVNQFMGDGFLASFGAPASPGNHSQNAVNASLEILKELENRCSSGKLIETKIGIGLHTGEIVTGNVGTTNRKQYSVTGNTVILASRIEQLNKSFKAELLVSKEVMNDIDDISNFTFTSLGPIQLKGRSAPIEVFKLVST